MAEETANVSEGRTSTGRGGCAASGCDEHVQTETSGDGEVLGEVQEADGRADNGVANGTPHGATTWSYLSIHNMKVAAFEEKVKRDARFKCFIHKTWQKVNTGGTMKKQLKPTVSGLVFLQGSPTELQNYLNENFYPCYLLKDCSTGRTAVISDSQMQPFMRIASVHPERIRFLRKPFAKFAEDHTLLRVLTGPFAGQEGYIVRIDRDRKLVMDFGGIAVAFSGIRNEDVEPVK